MAGYGFVNGRIQEIEDPMQERIEAGAKRIKARNEAANIALQGMKQEYDAAESAGDTATMKQIIAKRDAYKKATAAANWEDQRDNMVYAMRRNAAYGNGPTMGQAEAAARWNAERMLGGTGSAKKAIGYQILAGLGSTGGAVAAMNGPGGAVAQNGNAFQQRAWAIEDRDARYKHERDMADQRAAAALEQQGLVNEGNLAVEQLRSGAQTGVAGIDAAARRYAADKQTAAQIEAANISSKSSLDVANVNARASQANAAAAASAQRDVANIDAQGKLDVAKQSGQTALQVAQAEAQARQASAETAANAQRDVANINANAQRDVANIDAKARTQVAQFSAFAEQIKQQGTAGKTEKQLDSQKRFMDLVSMAQRVANGGMEQSDLQLSEMLIDRMEISEHEKAERKAALRQGNFGWMVPYIMQQAQDAAKAAGYNIPMNEAEATQPTQGAQPAQTSQPSPAAPKKPRKSYL